MKKHLFRIFPFTLLVGLSHGAVLFQEDFGPGTAMGGNWSAASNYGWEATVGNAGNNTSYTTNTAVLPNLSLGMHTGVNSSLLSGYLAFQRTGTAANGYDAFIRTGTAGFASGLEVASIVPADYTSLTATWNRSGDGFASGGGYYFTVLVNGVWYGSAVSPATGTPTPLNLLTATWREILNSPSGPSLTLGSPASDIFAANAAISGVGFFVNDMNAFATSNQTFRIDNLNIEGIPEPSTAVLTLIATAALSTRRKR